MYSTLLDAFGSANSDQQPGDEKADHDQVRATDPVGEARRERRERADGAPDHLYEHEPGEARIRSAG